MSISKPMLAFASLLCAGVATASAQTSSHPGLYITNAVVSPEGFAQCEVVAPSNGLYSLLLSTNLQSWDSIKKLDSWNPPGDAPAPTNRFFINSDPLSAAQVGNTFFLRVVVGLVPKYQLLFHFHNTIDTLAVGTSSVSFPQSISDYSAHLDVERVTSSPDGSQVFFTGPPGSGLTNAMSTGFSTDPGGYDAWYDSSPMLNDPAVPPPGRWTINYNGTNLIFDLPDAQTPTRFVVPQPTVVVSNGLLSSVSWIYRNATTGQALAGPPAFLSDVVVEAGGGTPHQRIYDSNPLPRATTAHSFSPALLWSDVADITISYDDDLGNRYIVFYIK